MKIRGYAANVSGLRHWCGAHPVDVRQQEINAEIIELVADETAGRSDRARSVSAKYRRAMLLTC